MSQMLTEHDLEELPEPTRTRAFELLWLLRESCHAEQVAIELAWRGAQEGGERPADTALVSRR